jgi:Kef-type K+ transport system membrane component KefB
VAAAAFALVARGVRQPPILGYILAGAALGPHVGLGLVADEASIELLSEMGLIFLLFIIGLEINVPALAQAGRTIVISGLLQFPLGVLLAGECWPAWSPTVGAASTGSTWRWR